MSINRIYLATSSDTRLVGKGMYEIAILFGILVFFSNSKASLQILPEAGLHYELLSLMNVIAILDLEAK